MSVSNVVLLVGRNAIVREGLSRILADNGFTVAQSVGTLAELEVTGTTRSACADLIVIDPVAWTADITEVAATKSAFPGARVVALLDKFDMPTLVTALRSGADGLLVTEISCASLVESLRLAAKGERVLPSALAELLPGYVQDVEWQPDDSVRSANLSGREIEILRCLIMGCPNTLIARRLDISEAAVKVHVKAVLRKIPVRNRTQAAIWAVKRGITAFDGTPVERDKPLFQPAAPAPAPAPQAMQQALQPAA